MNERICPECGEEVTRDQPSWGPKGGPMHHDPCPTPEDKAEAERIKRENKFLSRRTSRRLTRDAQRVTRNA